MAEVVRRAPQIAGDLIRRTLATDLPSAGAARRCCWSRWSGWSSAGTHYPMTEARGGDERSPPTRPTGPRCAICWPPCATGRVRSPRRWRCCADAVDDPRVPTHLADPAPGAAGQLPPRRPGRPGSGRAQRAGGARRGGGGRAAVRDRVRPADDLADQFDPPRPRARARARGPRAGRGAPTGPTWPGRTSTCSTTGCSRCRTWTGWTRRSAPCAGPRRSRPSTGCRPACRWPPRCRTTGWAGGTRRWPRWAR